MHLVWRWRPLTLESPYRFGKFLGVLEDRSPLPEPRLLQAQPKASVMKRPAAAAGVQKRPASVLKRPAAAGSAGVAEGPASAAKAAKQTLSHMDYPFEGIMWPGVAKRSCNSSREQFVAALPMPVGFNLDDVQSVQTDSGERYVRVVGSTSMM